MEHATLPDERGWEPAEYRSPEQEPEPRLKDNPMALVFPAPDEDRDIWVRLRRRPKKRLENFNQLSRIQRQSFIASAHLFHFLFEPGIDFVLQVLNMVRMSYLYRTPLNARIMAFILGVVAGKPGLLPRQSDVAAGGGLGMLLIGPSGVGKSSLIDRLVEYLGKKARLHLSLGGRPCRWFQLGVVRVNVGESWKDTLTSILSIVDWQLGTDYLTKRERASPQGVVQKSVWSALSTHFCPLLILDEFQTLGKLGDRDARRIINGLIRLMDELGVPVLIVGTESVWQLFERFPAEMGKFTTGGPYRVTFLSEDGDDFKIYVDTYKKQHVSLTEPVWCDDFHHQLYLYTMGAARIVREYMRVIFKRHSENEALKIDSNLLADIAKKEMRHYERALSVLRKRGSGLQLTSDEKAAYEQYLPPDDLTRADDTMTGAWLRAAGARGEMSAQALEVWRNQIANAGVELSLTDPIAERLQKEFKQAAALPPAAPAPTAAPAPPSTPAPQTSGATGSRSRRQNAASEKVDELAQSKVRSLQDARQKKAGDKPSGVTPDQIE